MSLDGIIADDYGQAIQLTVIDIDTDAAADVSAYTSAQQFILEDPDGNSSTKTAAFDSDGSDGKVNYTLADGDIDEAGTWRIRVRLTSGSAKLTSAWHSFLVLD